VIAIRGCKIEWFNENSPGTFFVLEIKKMFSFAHRLLNERCLGKCLGYKDIYFVLRLSSRDASLFTMKKVDSILFVNAVQNENERFRAV